jgi:pimeloyl-ACP methyl ester carboxylesterase
VNDTVVSVDDPQSAIANSYTFVLVHGGCHDGSMWQPVIERLEQLGHTAYGPTVAGHGKDVPKNVTHAESTQSIVEFILDRDLTAFILVGHGYAGTTISKVVEVIPERVRRLVFWSAYVLNDGETVLEMLPDSAEALTQMAANSADSTFTIPFEMWRDVFINDGEAEGPRRGNLTSSMVPNYIGGQIVAELSQDGRNTQVWAGMPWHHHSRSLDSTASTEA